MLTGMIGKHLIAAQDWTDEELNTLLDVAKELKMRYANRYTQEQNFIFIVF